MVTTIYFNWLDNSKKKQTNNQDVENLQSFSLIWKQHTQHIISLGTYVNSNDTWKKNKNKLEQKLTFYCSSTPTKMDFSPLNSLRNWTEISLFLVPVYPIVFMEQQQQKIWFFLLLHKIRSISCEETPLYSWSLPNRIIFLFLCLTLMH